MSRLSRPRPFRLRAGSARSVAGGHPWLFRRHLGEGGASLADGQWLRLEGPGGEVVGHGFYEAEGAIAIRVLDRGARAPDAGWVRERVEAALARRRELHARTDALRLLHGEHDRLPGVVLDLYGRVAVLQTYARGADALGRLAADRVRRALELDAVLWKPPRLRLAPGLPAPRVLAGEVPARVRVSEEEGLSYAVDPRAGHKTGAFLDLRGLRRWVAGADLAGARVLNLFSHAGVLGLAAERAGAAEVWNLDRSREALDFGAAHHQAGRARVRWIEADVFSWLEREAPGERFDLVIVDPPQMTSRASGLSRALRAYRRLYRAAASRVAPGGRLVACSCTAKVRPGDFRRLVRRALGPELQIERDLPPEPDHPVAFPEGHYLKVTVHRRRG